jgi:hypothetical protein
MMLTGDYSEFDFSFKLSRGDVEQNRSKRTKRDNFFLSAQRDFVIKNVKVTKNINKNF